VIAKNAAVSGNYQLSATSDPECKRLRVNLTGIRPQSLPNRLFLTAEACFRLDAGCSNRR
jgi:hypothetical protein